MPRENKASFSDEQKQRAKEIRRAMRPFRRKNLCMVESGMVMICIQYQKSRAIETYIIAEDKREVGLDSKTLLYSSLKARELMTAAFREERNSKGMLHERPYHIYDVIFRTETDHLSHLLLPYELGIQKDGGFASSVKDANDEIVDLLIFSPFTNRYELLTATVKKQEACCYTDISNYRDFVHSFGNPGLLLFFDSSTHTGKSTFFNNLNPESVLRGYGYTVSGADNYPAEYRQELLAEIVDLSILPVYKIVQYLEFFIQSHSAPIHSMARSKWREDLEFIKQYNINPSRFLIVQKKNK